jgi:hypothetical protein
VVIVQSLTLVHQPRLFVLAAVLTDLAIGFSVIALHWVLKVPNLWVQWLLMNVVLAVFLGMGNTLLELFILKTQWYFFDYYYRTGLFN